MADKLTQQITEALIKAAAEPLGLPLYLSKAEPGLFPSTSSGKLAAQKSLNDGLFRVAVADGRAKSPRELYALTETGWNYLLDQVNPKQVLEDFVRVLEARSCEVGELLDTARRMAESLQGLKQAVTRVLPTVMDGRISAAVRPCHLTSTPAIISQAFKPDSRSPGERRVKLESLTYDGERDAQAIAVLEPSDAETANDLSAAIVAQLSEWSGTVGEDCPLPKLFQCLVERDHQSTIGEFHDSLRKLYAEKAIYLHPWTGPLYALPEPTYALLAGHNIAYYASIR